MSTKTYFWRKTKWFWKHPIWYILLWGFFVNSYMLWFGRVLPPWHVPVAALSALIMGFIGSSAMIYIDLSQGYHKH